MHTLIDLVEFGTVDAFVLAVACVGVSLQFGVTNYVNFAYASLITFGAYMAYTADSVFHFNYALTIASAAVSTGLLAVFIGHFIYGPFVRRRPQLLFALVVTFAVALMLESSFLAIWGAAYKQLSFQLQTVFSFGPIVITAAELSFVGLGLGCLAAIHISLRYTSLGKSMRAMADDLSLARVCGLNTGRITDFTWLLSGALAGVAGVIQAMEARAFTFNLGDGFIYLVFAAVIVGGIGRMYGAVVGAIVIGLATQLSVPLIGSALSPVLVFAVLIIVMLVRPNGLLGSTGRAVFSQA